MSDDFAPTPAYTAAERLISLADADLENAKRPTAGKRVEVTRGRRVPRGTIGIVTFYMATQFGMRVRIDGPDGQVWTAAKNVDVVDPENYVSDWQEMIEQAADAAFI
jgi:hypothetical protein